MSETKQTKLSSNDCSLGYEQLLEQILETAPKVGKALVHAHRNRIKELNRYLNEDTLRKHFLVSYFEGLEEMYCVLDAIREAYEHSEALKDIAFLVTRVRADFESAVDAGLAGFNGVVMDTMRDVMEVEYLLKDFLHDKQQMRKWLNADRTTLTRDFSPNALRRRHAAALGTVPEKLPDTFEYRGHSEGLHVSPSFSLDHLAGKGFTKAPAPLGVEFCFAEIFEHSHRIISAAHNLGTNIEGVKWTGPDLRTCTSKADKAWKRTMAVYGILIASERAARTRDIP